MRIFHLLTVAILLICPIIATAHGGYQKIVDGKYLLNLSSSPITPEAGQEQQSILAVSDLQNTLIEKDIIFTIEIRKDEQVISRNTNLIATGGLLSFNYMYPEEGIYELVSTFRIPGDATLYEPEDFWIQVNPITQEYNPFAVLVFGILVGIAMCTLKPCLSGKRPL